MAQFVVLKNFVGPIIGAAIAAAFLLYFRGRVKEVIADERDYAIGGKSARWAIQIYSWIAIVFMFIFYANQSSNPVFEAIAQTLAYSTCFLLIVYSVVFGYLNKHEKPH